MTKTNEAHILKDLKNKKLTVTREFDASLEQVWKSWTQSHLLDLWWAPDPCEAQTRFMDFREGGHWLYLVSGPDDLKSWARVDFIKIDEHKSFESRHFFCDEKGNKNLELPEMHWKNEFKALGKKTKVAVEIRFNNKAHLEKIIEMGFERGLTTALEDLEELLAK